jgi:[glutamine synthetase] adenylyltransferase / [glutamine synthetase]-adenylyl-L-tyrosine phosphorylase
MRNILAIPAPDPPLIVDADLRPEGRGGPLVRSLAAYRLYYTRWSKVWEAQALLRARFVAGDADLGARFLALADEVRYPQGGLTPEQVVEIRRIKARVEGERLRGADPGTQVKLGRGGLADVEWVVQLMQLRHAYDVVELRTTETLAALSAARTAGLIEAADADALATAWTSASRVRNALMLVRGRPSDQLPRQGVELAGVVRILGAGGHGAGGHGAGGSGTGGHGAGGHGGEIGVGGLGLGGLGLGGLGLGGHDNRDPGGAGEFLDDYLRMARHARNVFERLFSG